MASITQFSLFFFKRPLNWEISNCIFVFKHSTRLYHYLFFMLFSPFAQFLRLEDVEIIIKKTWSDIKRSFATLFGPFKESFLLIFHSMCASFNVHIWEMSLILFVHSVKQSLETCEMNCNEWKRKKNPWRIVNRDEEEKVHRVVGTERRHGNKIINLLHGKTWQNGKVKLEVASHLDLLFIAGLRHLTWKFNRIRLKKASQLSCGMNSD